MTVSELIAALHNFDPSLPVVVDGYEGGFNDTTHIKSVELVANVHEEDYYGPHDTRDSYNTTPTFTAVYIPR